MTRTPHPCPGFRLPAPAGRPAVLATAGSSADPSTAARAREAVR